MTPLRTHAKSSYPLRLFAVTSVSFLIAGCGTFQLASGSIPPPGKTKEQQQLDTLSCKDRAKLEANTADRQVGAFALGLTIVGAPLAYELEKSKQREVFKTCMEERGYRVLPPNDGPNTASASASAQGTPPPARAAEPPKPATPTPVAPTAASQPVSPPVSRDEATQLQKLKELREKGLISEDEYASKRKEILDRL